MVSFIAAYVRHLVGAAMKVAVVNSMFDAIVEADIRADHVERMLLAKAVMRGEIINAKGEVTGYRLEMRLADFIAYLNEQAI